MHTLHVHMQIKNSYTSKSIHTHTHTHMHGTALVAETDRNMSLKR